MYKTEEERPDSKPGNELMIETHPDGYNSGRTYYLQAESEILRNNIVKMLSESSALALDRAQAQSAFAQTQRRVERVYRSSPFQSFFAFLIVAVRILLMR
jgi:hypothetical protein